MNKTAIIDFDDLTDTNDPWDALQVLKERDNGFKVTLFSIPTRLSERTLGKYDAVRDWVSLAIHGWRHARHECLAWTSEETADKLGMACKIYPGFSRAFKAPNWEICDEVYKACGDIGFVVADHIRNIPIIPHKQRVYIYNQRLKSDTFNRLHGHIQPWAGTGITENADGSGVNPAYLLPVGTQYGFVTDAATERQGVG